MPNDKVIKSLDGESYKYLGALEADIVMVNKMKEKLKNEYYRRVRKVLDTKLNRGNVFKANNTWAVSVGGEIFCSILRVVKTSTRGEWQENEKVANYAQWIPA